MVNRITPILEEPFLGVLNQLVNEQKKVDEWFEASYKTFLQPIYGSVDLRNAGFKIAPIDMNLFPAGFNNLNANFFETAVAAAKNIIDKLTPEANNILLLPESHTRNLKYFENINKLKEILEAGGYKVRLGSLSPETDGQKITLANEKTILVEKLLKKNNKVSLEDFAPDLILLNNDLSSGIPELLQNLDQSIYPSAKLGWSTRLKSMHFQFYAETAYEFAKTFGFDSWLIAPLFRHCGQIDFLEREGMICLYDNASVLFSEIQKKYDHYGIKKKPFLIVKADAGTYGMAVMTVRDKEELVTLNRKQRTKMSSIKGGQPVDKVMLQEGIYSFETMDNGSSVAEPVIYLFGGQVVGGFYRVHPAKNSDESLNAPGMHFVPFPVGCHTPNKMGHSLENQYFLYGIIAKLSMLSAAKESKQIEDMML